MLQDFLTSKTQESHSEWLNAIYQGLWGSVSSSWPMLLGWLDFTEIQWLCFTTRVLQELIWLRWRSSVSFLNAAWTIYLSTFQAVLNDSKIPWKAGFLEDAFRQTRWNAASWSSWQLFSLVCAWRHSRRGARSVAWAHAYDWSQWPSRSVGANHVRP